MRDGTYTRFDCNADPDDTLTVFFGDPQNDDDLCLEIADGPHRCSMFLSDDDARELARQILSHLPPQSDA